MFDTTVEATQVALFPDMNDVDALSIRILAPSDLDQAAIAAKPSEDRPIFGSFAS